MRLALLTGVAAAALSFVGAAGAQAQTIYMTEDVVAPEPSYAYTAPVPFSPFGAPRYMVTEPAPAFITEPPLAIAPRERVVIERERTVIAPPERTVITRERVAPLRERATVTRERVATPHERTVVARERMAVAPRERTVVTRERTVAAPRERTVVERTVVAPPERTVIEREQVVVAPRERVLAPAETGIVTTGYSTSRSCLIDRNGFERCY